jgi:hypothetical protein
MKIRIIALILESHKAANEFAKLRGSASPAPIAEKKLAGSLKMRVSSEVLELTEKLLEHHVGQMLHDLDLLKQVLASNKKNGRRIQIEYCVTHPATLVAMAFYMVGAGLTATSLAGTPAIALAASCSVPVGTWSYSGYRCCKPFNKEDYPIRPVPARHAQGQEELLALASQKKEVLDALRAHENMFQFLLQHCPGLLDALRMSPQTRSGDSERKPGDDEETKRAVTGMPPSTFVAISAR